MDAQWFHDALEQVGASQADLARHLGLAQSAVSRMLKGERRMNSLETVKTADFLRVSPEEVLSHLVEDVAPPPAGEAPRRGRPPGTTRSLPMIGSTQDAGQIPILSAGRGGIDQQMFMEIGHTPRPANLASVREAYAIYMVGDSMEPRYEQGWLLHINPFKPPVRGRDVVVRKRGDAVLIKQFVGWEGDALVLRQLNPPETLRIPRSEVIECHLVVGADQEG